jgi:WD40 repeat protein
LALVSERGEGSVRLVTVVLLILSHWSFSLFSWAGGPDPIVLSGHEHWIEEIAFSSDGRWLASGSGDRTIKIWDLETLREHITLETGHGGEGPEQGVTTVAFSPDGTVLASGGYDGKVRLWSTASWGEEWTLEIGGRVQSVAFDPGGKRLAVGGSKGLIVWDREGRASVWEQPDLGSNVRSVSFSPDGEWVASVIESTERGARTIKIWSAEGGALMHTLSHGGHGIMDVAFSTDGKILVSAGWDDRLLKLWDVETGEIVRTHLGHPFDLTSVAFSSGGRYLASADIESVVQLWEAGTGEGVRTLLGHTDYVWSLAFDPKGRWLASAGRDRTIRLWSLREMEKSPRHPRLTLAGHANGVAGLAFLSSGERAEGIALASVSCFTGRLKYWGVQMPMWLSDRGRSFLLKEPYDKEEGYAYAGRHTRAESVVGVLATSPVGYVATAGPSDHAVRLWRPGEEKPVKIFSGHTGRVASLDFSPDGGRLASAGADGFRIWNVEGGDEVHCFPEQSGALGVRFLDGDRLVLITEEGAVKTWNMQNGEKKEVRLEHAGSLKSWAIHREMLAVGTEEGEVILWDHEEGKVRRTFSGHERAVLSLAFDPEGTRLASGGEDGTIGVWDLESGKKETTLLGHGGWVLSVAFSPGGALLVSGGFDGMVRLWPMTQKEGETLEEAVVRRGGDYLMGTQKPDGSWEASSVSDLGTHPSATALSGMALLAAGAMKGEGPAREAVVKTRDWALRWVGEELTEENKWVMTASLTGLFLGSLPRQEASVREALERIKECLVRLQRPDGGWRYGDFRHEGGGDAGGMTFLTNWVVPCLVLCKERGIPLEDEVCERARGFYRKTQKEDGAYPYHAPFCWHPGGVCPERHLPSDPGRSIGALWAMHLLGMEGEPAYEKTLAFAREHWRGVAGAKHGPAWSLWNVGMGLRSMDKTVGLWNAFWDFHRDDILVGQADNGSIRVDAPVGADYPMDANYGPVYTTALYVHFLALRDQPLLLHRLKPLGKK